MSRIPYLAQALVGRSRWYDFAIGAWFILLAWIVSQLVFQTPLTAISTELGLDAMMADNTAAMLEQVEANAAQAALGGLMALLGVVIGVVCYLIHRNTQGGVSRAMGILSGIGVAASLVGAGLLVPAMGGASNEASSAWLGALLSASPLAYALLLLSFVGAFVGAWLVQRFVHGRTFLSLLTAARRYRWMRMVWVLLLTWGVYALTTFVFSSMGIGGEIYINPERSRMLPFVVATLLFIPIQCAAEEIMFRGYFNQALGKYIPSALVVFAITSIAFGAMHLANPEIATAKEEGTFWLAFSSYVLFGFLLSVMVWIDNGLEAAIGVHIANNAWAATFINYEGSVLPIPGLFLSSPAPTDIVTGLVALGLVTLGVWMTRKPMGVGNDPLADPAYATPLSTAE